MKIFTATYPFFHEFRQHYSDLKVISGEDDVKTADMIIFTGGEDINPAYYGELPTHTDYFSSARDKKEEDIFWQAIAYKVPKILGVCRGHQLICALLGGKLFQDIYTQTEKIHGGRHPLEFLNGGGDLIKFFKEVNSMHHQGVYAIEKLIPTSYFGGVFESCQGKIEETNITTVQFHPEFMQHTEDFFQYIMEK